MLTDLRVAFERGVFPVYFENLPTSESVSVFASTQLSVPSELTGEGHATMFGKWKRMLVMLTKVSRAEAERLLLEIPDTFPTPTPHSPLSRITIYLIEFEQMGRRVFHPALVVH
jgi:hypothetical protein